MCTVTYLPRPSGFILTHNRDEAPSRSSPTIVQEKTPGGETLLFPRDSLAGGTWIATSRRGRTACLLNGAFTLHKRVLPYRSSRGLILLDFFDWENPDTFFQKYDFEGIEPFTMLCFEQGQLPESLKLSGSSLNRIYQFRWDGQQRYLENLPVDQAHFWCSATLYPPEMQVRREQVFREWLTNYSPILPAVASAKENTISPITSHQSILALHRNGRIGDPENDYVMIRTGKVQTVSITQIIVDEKNARMRYFDLVGGKRSERRLNSSQRAAITVNR
ncbi:MAG: NRDE family protein [Saprospiraceae bacterium]|nr:NRDE family protein [Saprospiraceae bacterium]